MVYLESHEIPLVINCNHLHWIARWRTPVQRKHVSIEQVLIDGKCQFKQNNRTTIPYCTTLSPGGGWHAKNASVKLMAATKKTSW